MIFTGIVKSPFETGWFFIVDGYGNLVTLPTVSAFSLVFSVLNMIKTLISLNIVHIHVEVIIILIMSLFNSPKNHHLHYQRTQNLYYRESVIANHFGNLSCYLWITYPTSCQQRHSVCYQSSSALRI